MSALDTTLVPDLRSLSELTPPATLAEARDRRDALALLLGREREAAADFLLALADFDRRRGWERLGHASLFAFLTRELGLSNGAAWLRLTGARLLPRHPAVEAALRDGRLCLSAVGEVSRVLTEANAAEVLPRFFGRSSREAREVAAAILPAASPARREVVTLVPAQAPRALLTTSSNAEVPLAPRQVHHRPAEAAATRSPEATPLLAGAPLRAHEVASTPPAREIQATVEPLTAELRRLHVTVSARFLEKVKAARDGLSHALPGATTEQVLEAALDLLLEKQARSKALVKRPRKERAGSAPEVARSAAAAPREAPPLSQEAIPAAVAREVRLRDGDRCQFPLDAGGVCGATWQVQLDHLVPRRLGGPSTVANLRCACSFHNRYAAELALGPVVAGIR